MSSNEKQSAQQGQQPYLPPPPPGPPPLQTSQTQVRKHSNETPIPDYNIPTYNPAQPQFAPPPQAADDDIYNASPTDGNPPKFPDNHHHPDEDASKKKSHRLSGLGHTFTTKVAGPVNALAHKFGSEGFLPESLEKECEKAARILRGFCSKPELRPNIPSLANPYSAEDGIYSDTAPQAVPAPTTTTGQSTNTKPTVAEKPTTDGSKARKSRVLLTIPSKVIARAQGLAIFTAVRVGFQATGSSGSGILIARLPDGSWSPPSGIQVTSIGAGFVAGLDIYDCVIVINTREALELFTRTRLSLGSDLTVTAGPFGAGGALDWGVPPSPGAGQKGKDKPKEKATAENQQQQAGLSPPPLSADNTRFQTQNVPEQEQLEPDERLDPKDRRPSPFREVIKKPVYSYVKSRGFYAGIQIDGTVVAEREGANAKFYGQAVPVAKILKGEVPGQGPQGMWPIGARSLYDVLKGAEGGWRSQQQGQGRPVSPAPVTPTFDPNVGAPQSTWVPGVTAGVRGLDIGGSAAGPSAVYRDPHSPAGAVPPTTGASAKAAEAAADAARAETTAPPPPGYTEQHDPDDLPPAYVEDENYRPPAPGDSKTDLH